MRQTIALALCLLASAASAQAPLRTEALSPAVSATERFDRYSAAAAPRIGFETIGATLGALVAVGGSMALALVACNGNPDDLTCNLHLMLGPPAALFLPSIGVYVAGAYNEGAGGYWLSVAGSTTGWVTALLVFSLIPKMSASTQGIVGTALALLPVSGAVAGYELSSLKTLTKNLPSEPAPVRVTFVPWVSPTSGAKGLALQGAF